MASERHQHVHDQVYGLIELGEPWYQLLNNPWIQRLRRIKQTGPLFLVFPGCEHTRFSHTVGVLHLMRRLRRSLEGVEPPVDRPTPYEWLVFELAALLHDAGHLPFSHTIEGVVASLVCEGTGDANVSARVSLYDPGAGTNLVALDSLDPGQLLRVAGLLSPVREKYHEQLAAIPCRRVLLSKGGQDAVRQLASLEGIDADLPADPKELAEEVASAIWNSVGPNGVVNPLKNTIDVDRLDYIQRDSICAGLHYGRVALDHVLAHVGVASHVQVATDAGAKPNILPATALAFQLKRLHVLEHLVLSRYALYTNVMSHPTNLGWDAMLRGLILGLLGSDEELRGALAYPEESLEDEDRLHLLTDGYIECRIARCASRDPGLLGHLARAWRSRSSPTLAWGYSRLIRATSGPKRQRVTFRLCEALGEVVEEDLRPFAFASTYTVRVLPEEDGQGIERTACVLNGEVAVPIQDRPESLLYQLRADVLVTSRVYVWGPAGMLERDDLVRRIGEHAILFQHVVDRELDASCAPRSEQALQGSHDGGATSPAHATTEG